MKRRPLTFAGLILVALTGLLLAACGGPATPFVQRLPTATPTPRSTPLPPVATEVPLASEARPLTILMLPQESRRAAAGADDDLETIILDLASLVVDVQLVDSYGEIVAQLCSANPVVGWVDGLAYAVAEAQGCAEPALQIERDDETGFRVDFLAAADWAGDEPNADDIGRLAGEDICRISSEDTVSWLIPSLMLYTYDINPLYDFDEVIDVESYDAIVAGILNGDCEVGAVPHGYLDDLSEEVASQDEIDEEIALLQTSAPIPYDMLVYPQTVPLNVRIPLSDVFMQIGANGDHAETLNAVLRQDGIRRITMQDLEAFRIFILESGLDFATLGE